LEIELVASAGYQQTLHMTAQEVGLTGTVYLVGQVVGAVVFGRLSDRLGRKPEPRQWGRLGRGGDGGR
jgi:MFS family permease